jgi:hypothetical protein
MKTHLLASFVLCGLLLWDRDVVAVSCGDPSDSCYGNCGFQGTWCDCDSLCTSRGTCCEDYEECCLGCTPKCPKDYCGDDGCGGKCSCPYGPQWSCVNDKCVCTPYCQGAECGKDGCGGSCGTCPQGYTCAGGKCVLITCTPNCFAQECGNGGCPDQPNACGTCPAGKTCNVNGQCVGCEPQCSGKECGDDGCGGTCGSCKQGYECNAQGKCVCVPSCAGKQCGPDGCGGTCGTCPLNTICNELGQCETIGLIEDILENPLPPETRDLAQDARNDNLEIHNDGHGYPEDRAGTQDPSNFLDTSPSSCPSGFVLYYGSCVPSGSHSSPSGGCGFRVSTSLHAPHVLALILVFSVANRLRRGRKLR